MGLFLILLVLAIIFFGLGFTVHILWVFAVVAFVVWLFSLAAR